LLTTSFLFLAGIGAAHWRRGGAQKNLFTAGPKVSRLSRSAFRPPNQGSAPRNKGKRGGCTCRWFGPRFWESPLRPNFRQRGRGTSSGAWSPPPVLRRFGSGRQGPRDALVVRGKPGARRLGRMLPRGPTAEGLLFVEPGRGREGVGPGGTGVSRRQGWAPGAVQGPRTRPLIRGGGWPGPRDRQDYPGRAVNGRWGGAWMWGAGGGGPQRLGRAEPGVGGGPGPGRSGGGTTGARRPPWGGECRKGSLVHQVFQVLGQRRPAQDRPALAGSPAPGPEARRFRFLAAVRCSYLGPGGPAGVCHLLGPPPTSVGGPGFLELNTGWGPLVGGDGLGFHRTGIRAGRYGRRSARARRAAGVGQGSPKGFTIDRRRGDAKKLTNGTKTGRGPGQPSRRLGCTGRLFGGRGAG